MIIVYKKIEDLKPAEYNPRKMSANDKRDIKTSLVRFGFVDPVVVNVAPDRLNVIVGGHQRVIVAKEMGMTEVPCVEVTLTLEKEMELNLRLNKNVAQWDWDLLANIKEEMLLDVGFDKAGLDAMFGIKQEGRPEVQFSDEVMLEHNYIVMYFDNPLDWQVAMDKFKLPKVKDLIVRKGQPVGIGRVVKGKDWINRIQ